MWNPEPQWDHLEVDYVTPDGKAAVSAHDFFVHLLLEYSFTLHIVLEINVYIICLAKVC